MKNHNRQFKLGMHSYTLHLHGCGESWGFQSTNETHAFDKVLTLDKLMDLCVEVGLDVLHMTLVDLDNDLSDEHLAWVKKRSEEIGLALELNVSFSAPCDPRINTNVKTAIEVGHKIGAQLVKFSLDIERPHPLTHSNMHPEVMAQLIERYRDFNANIKLMEKYNMKVAIENHCDAFADEVIWLVTQLDHPLIGICCDTINSLMVGEGIEECVRKMAPYTYCVHFCDNKIFADPDGTHSIGTVIGQGDIDCKRIMRILRDQAPEELDTINLEIELPLNGHTLEGGRQQELQGLKDSIAFMHDELNIGFRGR